MDFYEIIAKYKISDQAENINIWQLVNKTVNYFNNIVFISVVKNTYKKLIEKMENNSTLKMILLVCQRSAELLRLVGANGRLQSCFSQKDEKEKIIISKKFAEKKAFAYGSVGGK